MKWKAFFIIFEGLSLKQIKKIVFWKVWDQLQCKGINHNVMGNRKGVTKEFTRNPTEK